MIRCHSSLVIEIHVPAPVPLSLIRQLDILRRPERCCTTGLVKATFAVRVNRQLERLTLASFVPEVSETETLVASPLPPSKVQLSIWR